MAIEFLIGPAGSGKTHTCLVQVREALLSDPAGPPLIWIAPKQATFQLERDVLASGVRGFTRLQILPFDRVARWILSELGMPARQVLSEEGRVMVLQALLLEREAGLSAFRRSARTSGFAAQLSQVVRELQRAGIGPERLRNHAKTGGGGDWLSGKLRDLAGLVEGYRDWLEGHQLRDPDDLLSLAAAALTAARKAGRSTPPLAGLWLDGFAEMTFPEIDLLAALLPGCAKATLAFCLDGVPGREAEVERGPVPAPTASTSLWTVTSATFLRCEDRVRALGLPVRVRSMPESGGGSPRFRESAALNRLAVAWAAGDRGSQSAAEPAEVTDGSAMEGIQWVECADPEAEALLAVRLIHEQVRRGGGRYRDISVVVRRMEGYGDILQRTFRRHGIPYFADHREPMGHHPVAELTRSALRLAAFGWEHADWVGALKSGLVLGNPWLVDNLENAGLAAGLHGDEWMRPEEYRAKAGLSEGAVRELERPLAVFGRFRESVPGPLDGATLAGALRVLWTGLRVPEALERWQVEAADLPPMYRAIHHTAWEQIIAWNEALELAFAGTRLSPGDWLAIAEAGLSRLTLGIIPPSLDQVLVGAIDRARQPEVAMTLVLGLNEGVFPAAPATPALLNRVEREVLAENGLDLGWSPAQQAARENYYAYIACTRPSQRLCATWSRRSIEGKPLTRSSVAERLLASGGWPLTQPAGSGDLTAFDGRLKSFDGIMTPAEALSLTELLECPGWHQAPVAEGPGMEPVRTAATQAARIREELRPAEGESGRRLPAEVVRRLHPDAVLVSSVSALEDFAECPFRHFAGRQLRLAERDEFRADAAGTGTLLHAIVKTFHDRTLAGSRRWRDWDPASASAAVRQLGEELLRTGDFAPLTQDALVAWETRRRIEGLAASMEQIIAWMSTCAFDPVLAEFAFGDLPQARAAAWTLPLEQGAVLQLRGSIDRVDVCRVPGGPWLIAVYDYKMTARSPSAAELDSGLELQLLGYLAFAARSEDLRRAVAADSETLHPAGAFQIPLSPKVGTGSRPDDALEVRRRYLESLSHLGRGDAAWLPQFDALAEGTHGRGPQSRQFKPRQFLAGDAFSRQLELVTDYLGRHATDILKGTVGALPVRFGSRRTACDHCVYGAFCRFEPLQGEFRSLAKRRGEEPGPAGEGANDPE